jgi:hypothetical protein
MFGCDRAERYCWRAGRVILCCVDACNTALRFIGCRVLLCCGTRLMRMRFGSLMRHGAPMVRVCERVSYVAGA